MRTIGLSGFARVGKTEAANYIEQKYGFRRRHIAETLRAMLAVLMRANGISEEMIERYLVGDLKDGVVIPEFGLTSRQLQIRMGTECGRLQFGPNVWVDTWHRGIAPGEKAMNDSVRFPNEEAAIQEDAGITIMLTREGTGPAAFKWNVLGLSLGRLLYRTTGIMWGVHDSERTDRLNPTARIRNDGTLEDLYWRIDRVMERHLGIYDELPGEAINDNLPEGWDEVIRRWGFTTDELAAADPTDVSTMIDMARILNEREATEFATFATLGVAAFATR